MYIGRSAGGRLGSLASSPVPSPGLQDSRGGSVERVVLIMHGVVKIPGPPGLSQPQRTVGPADATLESLPGHFCQLDGAHAQQAIRCKTLGPQRPQHRRASSLGGFISHRQRQHLSVIYTSWSSCCTYHLIIVITRRGTAGLLGTGCRLSAVPRLS
ncbi:hypothetical protein ISCGN_004489 [Ixodes scapularis]